MSIPLKLFIDGPWTEIRFPIRPHDDQPRSDILSESKIMADSEAMEIRLLTNASLKMKESGISG